MAKIEDFGEKIGGAKKDWRSLLVQGNLDEISEEEMKNITKAAIIGKIDYEKLYYSGYPKAVLYFHKRVIDGLPVRPLSYDKNECERYIKFIKAVNEKLNDFANECKYGGACAEEIQNFYPRNIDFFAYKQNGMWYAKDEFCGYITKRLQNAMKIGYFYEFTEEMKNKKFLMTDTQKQVQEVNDRYNIFQYTDETIGSKPAFQFGKYYGKEMLAHTHAVSSSFLSFTNTDYYKIEGTDFANKEDWELGKYFVVDKRTLNLVGINYPTKEDAVMTLIGMIAAQKEAKNEEKKKLREQNVYLSEVKQEGVEYSEDNISTDDLQETFNFRGGEFGLWETEKERQTNLNMAYTSFCNLAKALDISVKDITFNGELAIAFGSRGQSRAYAHYEPEKKVINLTRLKGAGALAHEWGHALDYYLYTQYKDRLPARADRIIASFDNPNQMSAYGKVSKDAIGSLMNTMRSKMGSADEQEKLIREEIEKAKEDAAKTINNLIPDEQCSEAQKKEKDALLRDIQNNKTLDVQVFYMNSPAFAKKLGLEPDETVEKVKDLMMRMGLPVNKSVLQYISSDMASCADAYYKLDNIKAKKIETEYVKNALALDDTFHKTNPYYCKSTEMFARAFACYVHDRLAEQGIRDDYLTGLCEKGAMKNILPYPTGKEREAINKAFDELITEAKERGLFRDFDEREISVLEQEQDRDVRDFER